MSRVAASDISVSITVEETDCFDGEDNDLDTFIDYPDDPGCTSTLDDDETDPVPPQCSDGIDNDVDTLIDFPDDLGCDSASDDDESNDPPPAVDTGGGGGGGGGGGSSSSQSRTEIEYAGYAYPYSVVYVLVDGVRVASTTADYDGTFASTFRDLQAGEQTISFYSVDAYGLQSETVSVSLNLRRRSTVVMNEILIPPTVWGDKTQLVPGQSLRIEGQTRPRATVVLEVHSEAILVATTSARDDGSYSHVFDTATLENGAHEVRVRTWLPTTGQITTATLNLLVGSETVLASARGCRPQADLNRDCRVNLIDFSIMMYWYFRPLSPSFISLEKERLSGDGQLTLVDLSLISYYWNG